LLGAFDQVRRAIAILNACHMHLYLQHISQRIRRNAPLAAIDFLPLLKIEWVPVDRLAS
jgi:hypothetical protein